MRHRALMRFYQPFPAAIPLYEAGYPRVTHPSATKFIYLPSEDFCYTNSVRLACVRHAASVHPEPGSNSQFYILKILWFRITLTSQNNSAPRLNLFNRWLVAIPIIIYLLGFVLWTSFVSISWNAGIFRVALLFNCQSSLFVVTLSFAATCYILTRLELFVNNFFVFFEKMLFLKFYIF